MCEILSRKVKFIDYRPAAHKILYEKDHLFDSKLNAYLRCESLVLNMYENGFSRYDFSSLSSNSANDSIKTKASCILTDLSDSDRLSLISHVARSIENSTMNTITVIPSFCKTDSAYHFFDSIIDSFKFAMYENAIKSNVRNPINVLKMASISGSIVPSSSSRSHQLDILESLMVSNYLNNSVSSNNRSLTALISFAENIDSKIMGHIISQLVQASLSFHVNLIFFHSVSRPLTFPLSTPFQSSLELTTIDTFSSEELYDDVMSRVLALILPVTLPVEAVAWIHESFWRSERCVKSAVYRILHCLSRHFTSRRSILCMFGETRWLQEMNLVKSSLLKLSDEDVLLRNIREILPYLTHDDLKDTTVITSLHNNCDDTSIEMKIYQNLTAGIALRRYRYNWLHTLLLLRDMLLPHRRSEYPADMIYAAIITPRGSQCKILSDLLQDITLNIKKIMLSDLYETIQATRSLLLDEFLADDQYKLPREEMDLTAKFTSDLEICRDMFEELNEILLSESISPSQIRLLDLRQKIREGDVPTVSTESEKQSNDKNIVLIIEKLSDMTIVDIAENIVTDFTDCLVCAVSMFSRLPTRPSISGILEVSGQHIREAVKECSGSMRIMMSYSLLHPETVFQDIIGNENNLIPPKNSVQMYNDLEEDQIGQYDKSFVMNRAMSCIGTEHLYDWYEEFQSVQPHNKSKRKKTSRIVNMNHSDKIDDDRDDILNTEEDDVTLKCRFIRAINDLAHAGIIKINNTYTSVSRQCFTWMHE